MPNECKHEAIKVLLTSFARFVQESFCLRLFAQTSLLRRLTCTKTSGKYFPVQTSHSVNKPLKCLSGVWEFYIFEIFGYS